MRIETALLLLVASSSCRDSEPTSSVDVVEMRLSGQSSIDVELNSRGEGRYKLSEPLENGSVNNRHGSFTVNPQQYLQVVERLEPFRRQAVPFTDESALAFIEQPCPEGIPSMTDAGGVYIRWMGADLDQHYLADLGCDYQRNSRRNAELIGIMKTLPVPLDG